MNFSATENLLLSQLSASDLTRLSSRMETVSFELKEVAYLTGQLIEYVYFPLSGVLSSVVVMGDGRTAEVAVIGVEGMLGISVGLGANHSMEQVFCQLSPCECLRLPANDFASEVSRGGAMRDIAFKYLLYSMRATTQVAACNSLHSVNERCARLILMTHDRADGDEFPLTHDFLSTILGVRRASVSVTAGSFQTAGLITYRHGRVKILDRGRLEELTCECYRILHVALGRY